MKTSHHLLAVLVAGACVQAGAADGKNSWITVGESAYAALQKIAPQAVARESRIVRSNDMRSKIPATEQVRLVEISDAEMRELGEAIHRELKRCGGFMYHASEAEGRRHLSRQATPAGANTQAALARPAYVIDNQAVVPPVLTRMQASNIGQTIGELAGYANRYYTTTGGTGASNFLQQKWAGMASGRGDIGVTQFTHAGYAQKSVIATITGSDNASEVIVIGAHLDSISSSGSGENMRAPGADDDASGIASMTEVLRAIVASCYKPRRTIKLIGYAAEEVGLRGSQAIAASFKAANVNVVGVMQLDMTNYKGSASDIYIYTDYTDTLQNEFIAKLITAYQPDLTIGYDKCGYGCSDHASWTAQGYPASLPFEASFNQSNPYIHTASDTYANTGSQAAHALKFARLAASFAIELGSDGPGVVIPVDRVETFTGTLSRGQKRSFGPFKAGAGGNFKAETTGTGDTDLYVRRSSVPTTSAYNCKSDGPSSTETCTIALTANGDVYVLLNGYTAASYSLKVTYRPQ